MPWPIELSIDAKETDSIHPAGFRIHPEFLRSYLRQRCPQPDGPSCAYLNASGDGLYNPAYRRHTRSAGG